MKRFFLSGIVATLISFACQFSATPETVATNTPRVAEIRSVATIQELSKVTAYQSIHVRAERMGLRIGYLYYGNTVTLTGACDHGWAEIVWNDGTAWVNARYLSQNKCSEEK